MSFLWEPVNPPGSDPDLAFTRFLEQSFREWAGDSYGLFVAVDEARAVVQALTLSPPKGRTRWRIGRTKDAIYVYDEENLFFEHNRRTRF